MKSEQKDWRQRVVDELAKLGEMATVKEVGRAWGSQRIELESAVVVFTLDEPGVSVNKRWSFQVVGDPSTRYHPYYARNVSSPDRLNAEEIAAIVIEVARRQRLEPCVKELNDKRGWWPQGTFYFEVGRHGDLMLRMEAPVSTEQAHAMIAAAMACGIGKVAGAVA